MATSQKWEVDELRTLEKGKIELDTIGLRGRDATKVVIKGEVLSLLTNPDVNHGEYNVLVASGHVRWGKTRIGQEVSKSVSDVVCRSRKLKRSIITKAFYLFVNLGNGHGFEEHFCLKIVS